jgi:hypothetical protein
VHYTDAFIRRVYAELGARAAAFVRISVLRQAFR